MRKYRAAHSTEIHRLRLNLYHSLPYCFAVVPPSRPISWNIEAMWLFYLLAAIALTLFGLGLASRIRVWLKLSHDGQLRTRFKGLSRVIADGLLGLRIWRGDPSAGVMHNFIAWGFMGLLFGTALVAIHEYFVQFLIGTPYLVFSVSMEIFGLMLLIGLFWAGLRRLLSRPRRLRGTRALDAALPLTWLGIIGITGFLLEGARMSAQSPEWASWSFIGSAVAALPYFEGQALMAYTILWWVHALLSLGLIAWIPHGKLLHSLAAPLNLAADHDTSEVKPNPPTAPALYAVQLLSLDACTRCGRCTEACPSAAAEEPLSPREIVTVFRDAPALKSSFFPWQTVGSKTLLRDSLKGEPLWHCTSCGACRERCPVQVSPLELIAALRCSVVEEGQFVPPKLGEVLERIYKYQNPWVSKKGVKAAWSRDYELQDLSKSKSAAEWLYFVGCTTSLDTRAQNIARSLTMIFSRARISFGVLGKKEPCCGDIARRLGEKGLFEEGCEATLKLLRKRELTRLIVTSPHCFDTLSNAYPKEANLEVVHSVQLLARLLVEKQLRLTQEVALTVTFHDPCYLGRHNGIVSEPRQILEAIPGIRLVEMDEIGVDSLCCGGGGGRMWHEIPKSGDLAGRRIRQAAKTGASVVVTACPLCLIMLEDARKTSGLEKKIEVLDLSELVVRALPRESPEFVNTREEGC